MKNIIKTVVLSTLICLSMSVVGQNIGLLKKGVSKGNITLSDGKSMKFRNLQLTNDSLITYSVNGIMVENKTSDIFKVTKITNSAGLYALSCGAGGLLGSLSAVSSLNDLGYDGNSYVLFCTIAGTGIGALIGLMINQEKTVYKNTSSLSLYPSINTDQFGKVYPALSLRFIL